MCRHFVHHRLPGPLSHFRVVGCQISTSEIEIEGRLPMRFVHRIQAAVRLRVYRLCEVFPVSMNRSPASKKRRYAGGTVCI